MSTNTTYPHITIRPNGVAHIGDTRYKVRHLAGEHYHYGWSAEELLRQHPDLRPEEVYSALAYFYDHREEMLADMERAAEYAESMRSPSQVSREELLARWSRRKA